MATTTTMPQPLPLPSARCHKFLTCVSPGLPVPPRGHKFSTCVSPVLPVPPRGNKFLTCGIRRAPRPAFTLVELLVVIVILAMLASLVTMAASRAMTAARNAAIKSEIDMLHMAMMNYRSEYGACPPCADWRTSPGMNPASTQYTYTESGFAARHLKRLFPRCTSVSGQLTTASATTQFGPRTAVYAWLSGYTPDPASPLVPPEQRVKLYDFDTSRVWNNSYHPPGKRESSYIYIDAASYPASVSFPIVINSGTYSAQPNPTDPAGGYFNPDTFQILCAGRDEIFGNDDDLSNFWRGTRGEYRESSKQ